MIAKRTFANNAVGRSMAAAVLCLGLASAWAAYGQGATEEPESYAAVLKPSALARNSGLHNWTPATAYASQPGMAQGASPVPAETGAAAIPPAQPPASPPPAPQERQASIPPPRNAPETPAAASDPGGLPIVGDWFIADTGDTLTIGENGVWRHSRLGVAKWRPANDSADLKVFYNSRSITCSYRVASADMGKTLVLTADDNTQDGDYCPSGSLKSARN
jgi:hypothetical protein